MISRYQDRAIRLAHMRHCHLTATDTALNTEGTHNRRISPKTVPNRLRESDLHPYRQHVGLGPPLTQARRLRCMAWLTVHVPRRFPMMPWRRVLFADESRFTLFLPDGRHRVYRRRGEHFADACVDELGRVGGGSVTSGEALRIVVCCRGQYDIVRYSNESFRPVSVSLVQQRQLILQQDSAGPHVAIRVFWQTITLSHCTSHHKV